jgi:hypothetical protein
MSSVIIFIIRSRANAIHENLLSDCRLFLPLTRACLAGWNWTCGLAIPVQRSNQLSYRVRLSSTNHKNLYVYSIVGDVPPGRMPTPVMCKTTLFVTSKSKLVLRCFKLFRPYSSRLRLQFNHIFYLYHSVCQVRAQAVPSSHGAPFHWISRMR